MMTPFRLMQVLVGVVVMFSTVTQAAAGPNGGTGAVPPAAAPVEVSATAIAAVPPPVAAVAPQSAPVVVSPPSAVPAAPVAVLGGLIQGWQEIPQEVGKVPAMRIRRAELSARVEVGDGVTGLVVVDPALIVDDGVTTTPFLTSTATGKIAAGVTAVKRLSMLKIACVAMDRPFPQVPFVKRLTAGQFKVPFGMEGLKSGGEIDTVERAMQTALLGWSDLKDLGFMAQVGAGPFDLWAGGFQGEGQNRAEANDYMNANVRASLRPAGWLAIGAAYQEGRSGKTKDLASHAGAELSCAWTPGGTPVRLKGEYALGPQGPRGRAAAVRTGYGNLGVEVWPDHVELVTRYDWLDADAKTPRNWRTEATGGVSLWLANKRAKLQWNYIRVDEPTPKKKNDLMRINVQASF